MGILDGWRLCPRCGHELERTPGRAACPGCGSIYYANSAPAIEGLLERDGKVLLDFGPGELPAEMAFPHQDELLRTWRLGATRHKDRPNGS